MENLPSMQRHEHGFSIQKALVSPLKYKHPEAWLAKTLLQLNAALCANAQACKAVAEAGGFAVFKAPLGTLFDQVVRRSARPPAAVAAAAASDEARASTPGAPHAAAEDVLPHAAGDEAAAAAGSARDALVRCLSAELALAEGLRANQLRLLAALAEHGAALPREVDLMRRAEWAAAQRDRAERLLGPPKPPQGSSCARAPSFAMQPATELDLDPEARLAARAARVDARLHEGACPHYLRQSAELAAWLSGVLGGALAAGRGGGALGGDDGACGTPGHGWEQLLCSRLRAAASGAAGSPTNGTASGKSDVEFAWQSILGALLVCDAALAAAVRRYDLGRSAAIAEYRRLRLSAEGAAAMEAFRDGRERRRQAERAAAKGAPAKKAVKGGGGGGSGGGGGGGAGFTAISPAPARAGAWGRVAAALGLWAVAPSPMQRQYMLERARGLRLRAEARRLRAKMERMRARKERKERRVRPERFEGPGGLLLWAAWRLRLRLAGRAAAAVAEAAATADTAAG